MEKYEVLKVIGQGTFGKVSRVRRKSDGKELVWKEIDYGRMREHEKQLIVSEVNILRELRHPHIVRYLDRIIDKAHTKIYIVIDLHAVLTKRAQTTVPRCTAPARSQTTPNVAEMSSLKLLP